MKKGRLELANGESLDIEDIWLERGAIWLRAFTLSAKYPWKPGMPTEMKVYGADGSLVQRPIPGTFNSERVRPGEAWLLIVSMMSNQLKAEFEEAAAP